LSAGGCEGVPGVPPPPPLPLLLSTLPIRVRLFSLITAAVVPLYTLLQAIQELAGGRTITVIAHRLLTVKRADKILVLEEGKVVEFGTHMELLEKDGLYKRLCDMQFRYEN